MAGYSTITLDATVYLKLKQVCKIVQGGPTHHPIKWPRYMGL